ncbi:gamma-glutamyltransferase, partial [Candidatus Bathyarchaeota archaeon]|nr:gamma-glutamyltransferase [Candidatus Bathyarchaeota archaeon]
AWIGGVGKLRKMPNGTELLINGAPPEPGQLFKNEHLARVFERIATVGKDGFYNGEIASKIAHVVQDLGGKLTMEDLSAHESSFVDPVSISYRAFDVHEIPPNGQGITALLALNILNGFDLGTMDPSSHEYIHLLVESLRIAFADAGWFVADPDFHDIPLGPLLSDEYAAERRTLIDQGKTNLDIHHGEPVEGSDTVYLSVVDGKGNACSFINSNYMAFGTGIIPENCGFVLQNRGCNFSLEPGHPNRLEPKKRPYHTIIPAISTLDGELYACFGVMGGFMQPQGHVQVFSRLVDHGQDPQAALDAPRFCIEGGNPSGVLLLEESVSTKTAVALKTMGHETRMVSGMGRSVFGRGQIITRDPGTGVLWGGSDPRSDGCAIGL